MHVLPSRQKAFPFGEGVGLADERGLCLPLSGKVSALPTEEDIAFPLWGRCRHCRQKRTLPSLSGKVSALPTKEDFAFPLGKVSALPTKEVIAFPFGEGVGSADGRGHSLPLLGKVSALPTEEVCTIISVPTTLISRAFYTKVGL